MGELVKQLPTLIGVVVGAFGSYFFANLAERSRWRRQQAIRWDERRFEAYTLYSHAVKDVVSLASAVAAARGISTAAQPADLARGLVALAEAEALRSSRWESVLLLGDVETIGAARDWHESVWVLEQLARSTTGSLAEWDEVRARVTAARDEFYRSARRSLGVHGPFEGAGSKPPYRRPDPPPAP